jgi:2-hydroxy-4-carboxymuconate semialdehyde hemiacetal dehydrogenase
MDLSILLRTAHDQVVTVAMSYRALPPMLDYLVITDATTLVYANDELSDHARVLVPAADHGSYDAAALDRQNTDFFAAIRTGSEPVSSARSVRPAMAALQAAQDELDRQATRPGRE